MEDDKDSGVHIGTGVTVVWWRKLFSRKTIAAGIGVALLLVGFLGYSIWQGNLDARAKDQQVLNSTLRRVSALRDSNSFEQAYQLLKPLENKAKTKTQKVEYYSMMYLVASSTNRTAESLTYLDKKHQADPSTAKADAYSMALDYERLGNTSKALVQYKLALEYEKSRTGKEYYQGRIDRIEQSIKTLEGQK